MRTRLMYEVVREEFKVIKGLSFTLTLSKNDTVEQAEKLIAFLSEEIGINLFNGHWEEDFYLWGWLEMDRSDFDDYYEEYIEAKLKYKEMRA